MATQRLEILDATRGLAMVWMTVFHFCFDLNNAGILQQDFHHHPFWTWQRTCILSLFLWCAGAGQAIAHAQGQAWWPFARRWLQIAGAAGLVSLGSWFMFPSSYIYFGVLHGMAVMLLIVRLMAPLGGWCAGAGVVVIAIHLIAGSALSASASSLLGLDFDAPGLNSLGLITRLPITEDYVPVLPWLGVMLLGFAGMQWVLTMPEALKVPKVLKLLKSPGVASRQAPGTGLQNAGGQKTGVRTMLARLGRHSLGYYLLHQPVMLGLLWLAGVGV